MSLKYVAIYRNNIIFASKIFISSTKIIIYIQNNKGFYEKISKMVFVDYMNNLSPKPGVSEKRKKIREIAEVTCKSELAVYSWIRGDAEPDALSKKAISALLNIPVNELFPDNK